MDLIYTDSDRVDTGVLLDYSFDLAFGADENNYQLTVTTSNNVAHIGDWIYIEGTEYGGIIDSIQVDTKTKTINYNGRTFHGILGSKVITPDAGEDYYSVQGEAHTILATLITRLGLESLFEASSTASVINVSTYQFNRYTDAYTGIIKMLESANAKLKMAWIDGKVKLSAETIREYTSDEELDSDHVNFTITQYGNPVNHLICLGKGELRDRTVIDLYADEDGNISTTQTITGLAEVTEVYDYSSVESEEELESSGIQRLKELNQKGKLEMKLDDGYNFDIGDRVTATEIITGTVVTQKIIKKIVTINKGLFKAEYQVGEK